MYDLIQKIRDFNEERDWEQYHSPKNLAMALSVEVAEIVEQLQWLTQQQSRNPDQKTLEKIKEEIADVIIYVANLSDQLGIDPIQAAWEKLEKNRQKYPVDVVKGKYFKYSEYE